MVIKLIKSLENRRNLLKKTTKNINIQEGGFLGPLMRVGLPLMKNVITPLAKTVLMPLGLKTAASATHAAIQKNIYGSGITTMIISNEEMKDIMKIVESLEESGLLMKSVSKTIKNEVKEQSRISWLVNKYIHCCFIRKSLSW